MAFAQPHAADGNVLGLDLGCIEVAKSLHAADHAVIRSAEGAGRDDLCEVRIDEAEGVVLDGAVGDGKHVAWHHVPQGFRKERFPRSRRSQDERVAARQEPRHQHLERLGLKDYARKQGFERFGSAHSLSMQLLQAVEHGPAQAGRRALRPQLHVDEFLGVGLSHDRPQEGGHHEPSCPPMAGMDGSERL